MQQISWKERQEDRARRGIKALLLWWFRIELKGTYQPAINSVIIANRTSVIDVLLLCVFLPERLTFIIQPGLFKNLWIKTLRLFANVISMDPTNPYATKVLIKAIRDGKRCVIFPQTLVRQNESSLRIFDGPGVVLQKTHAQVIPIRIEGGQHSIFSIHKDKNRIQFAPRITLHILPEQIFFPSDSLPMTRYEVSTRLFRLINELDFANSFTAQSLFAALIQGASFGTKNRSKIEDSNRTPLSYRQFLARCFILGRQLKDQTKVEEHVGVMMPTTIAGMVTFFSLIAYRRIPAMLNFSSGAYNLISSCNTAGIKTIYTARQFITTAKLEPLMSELSTAGLKIIYLEEFKSKINLGNKLSGLIKGLTPGLAYRLIGEPVDPHDTGVILFTSGSEGTPKGVALSHVNILSNCSQMVSRVDFNHRDIFFNALPIFHSFGLTAGSIIPLVNGIKCFFYPSPLHYKIIPGLVYQTGATIMFGTDTFLTGYARAADANDFSSVRYIFAGAEKVKLETIRHWSETFGVRIFEGYGATEASPVISMNCSLAVIPGTVGMTLSQIETRIVPVDGIAEGGRLHIRGPNIMRGYICPDKPGAIQAPRDGWHDTGDIVTQNKTGFLTIAGRANRFARK